MPDGADTRRRMFVSMVVAVKRDGAVVIPSGFDTSTFSCFNRTFGFEEVGINLVDANSRFLVLGST